VNTASRFLLGLRASIPCQHERGRHVTDTETASEVTLASMNLHCGIDQAGRPYDVEAVVTGLDAQIIALQEAWRPESGPDPVAAAASALGAEVYRVDVSRPTRLTSLSIPGDVGAGQSGITVLSTLPVTGYETISFDRVRGDVYARRAQILTIKLPAGQELRLAATHLTHRGLSPLQLWQLVRRLDDGLGGAGLPTVIAGDLNLPRQIARLAPGYTPAVLGRTWPADQPVAQIDHMLTSRHIEAADATVLPPAGSDHRAIRARLRLRAAT
jgi:endonuclease/exonuclease/phosphatase family metal-dependent hydrolase